MSGSASKSGTELGRLDDLHANEAPTTDGLRLLLSDKRNLGALIMGVRTRSFASELALQANPASLAEANPGLIPLALVDGTERARTMSALAGLAKLNQKPNTGKSRPAARPPRREILAGIELEIYQKEHLGPPRADEIADYHAELFGNTMYAAICKNEDCERYDRWVTGRELLGRTNSDPLATVKEINAASFFCECGCRMVQVYQPDNIRKIFRERLLGPQTLESFVSMARNHEGGIDAMAYAYVTTLRDAFISEWRNGGLPFADQTLTSPEQDEADFQRLLKCVNEEVLVPGSPSYNGNERLVIWNHITDMRTVRWRNQRDQARASGAAVPPRPDQLMLPTTVGLLRNVADLVGQQDSPITENSLVLGEVIPSYVDPKTGQKTPTPAFTLFQGLNGRVGTGFFGANAGEVLIGARIKEGIDRLAMFQQMVGA